MKNNVKVIIISKSIVDYFKMVMDLDNESKEYKDIVEKEFKNELAKSLNNNSSNIKIKWVK